MRKALLSIALVFAILISFTQAQTQTVVSAKTSETATASERETIELPIVMYHSVLKSRNGKYSIHPDQLENDIIAFKQLGYTPITLCEVANWVDYKTKDFPEKPMIITFDDGHYNNLYYALPILKKHNCKAVINIVTSFSKYSSEKPQDANNPSYSYLTWDNIRELHESSLIEIGNHTHSMHKFKPRYGIAQVGGETVEEYKESLYNDIECAQSLIEKCGVPRPITFAYPFGKYSTEGRNVLTEIGFSAMLTCNEGISQVTKGDRSSLLNLKRYNRSGNISTEKFIETVFGKNALLDLQSKNQSQNEAT